MSLALGFVVALPAGFSFDHNSDVSEVLRLGIAPELMDSAVWQLQIIGIPVTGASRIEPPAHAGWRHRTDLAVNAQRPRNDRRLIEKRQLVTGQPTENGD